MTSKSKIQNRHRQRTIENVKRGKPSFPKVEIADLY